MQEQQQTQVVEQQHMSSRRPTMMGTRGRSGGQVAATGGPVTASHLLNTGGVDILTDGSSNRLLNG